MSKADKPSIFTSLLGKRRQTETDIEPETDVEPEVELEAPTLLPESEPEPAAATPLQSGTEKRRPGRPRGRRSNPDYTQISAYIPLDLLLDIQDELAKEKRRLRKRSAMTVSELAENLLGDWLKQRKSE